MADRLKVSDHIISRCLAAVSGTPPRPVTGPCGSRVATVMTAAKMITAR